MEIDPLVTRKGIRAADASLNTLAALLEGWVELPGGKSGITIAEALRILNDPQQKDSYTVLRGALMEWAKNDKLPGSGIIGHKMRCFRKRVIDKRMLDAEKGHGGVQRWKVVAVS